MIRQSHVDEKSGDVGSKHAVDCLRTATLQHRYDINLITGPVHARGSRPRWPEPNNHFTWKYENNSKTEEADR